MGWTSEDPEHEGYVAYIAPDDQLSSSSTDVGVLVRRPDADHATRWARRAGRSPRDRELYDLVPWDAIIGWQVACSCGWTGTRWDRSWTSPSEPGRPGLDPDDARMPDGRTVDEMAEAAWLAHVQPREVLGRVSAAADALAAARRNLDFAVWEARLQEPPASWADIGRATGMTRQAAREHWGGDPGPRPIPGEFDAARAVAIEHKLRRGRSV